MRIPNSLLQDLLQDLPHLRSQIYFKSALTALSHALEDLVLAGTDAPLVIANFQQERFYRQEARRYQKIAQLTNQVYVLAAPESESGFVGAANQYVTIALEPEDGLAQEWHLVIVSQHYAACLICREQSVAGPLMDQSRRFEGLWTFDRQVSAQAARLLLGRISIYRPELTAKVEQAWHCYGLTVDAPEPELMPTLQAINSGIFGQRLMTYLQAGQYKLLKAYRALAAKERKERFTNAMTAAIRRSLDPQDVLAVAVQELGQVFEHCRCLLYRCGLDDEQVQIEHEFIPPGLPSLRGHAWSLTANPVVQVALAQERAIAIADVAAAPSLRRNRAFKAKLKRWQICAWLIAPIRYQGQLLGMLELHHGGPEPYRWQENDIALIEAIVTQAGVALTQAQAYTDSEALNRKLEALERTRSNLIAIVGHELRTPLSTIQVCLESLEAEPDMPLEFQQAMLSTALEDSARLRRLIQDFLTLSQLEGGQLYNHAETMQLQESVDVALSALRAKSATAPLPQIKIEIQPELPTIRADGEGLVEVLTRLLDNACKFTESEGEVKVQAQPDVDSARLEVVVSDTGRGIEPSQLETIFDSFYQEEDSLRRTVGGTGLGLAICRQIIQAMGGQIWATSAGKNQGSSFHFTVPIELSNRSESPLLPSIE
ncbi:MAG: GAF domain-containing protein [Cyanothece sp. SIO1E1]|nr:GAF domain-containing protein [Cyanothece sp. SIO1E1]